MTFFWETAVVGIVGNRLLWELLEKLWHVNVNVTMFVLLLGVRQQQQTKRSGGRDGHSEPPASALARETIQRYSQPFSPSSCSRCGRGRDATSAGLEKCNII